MRRHAAWKPDSGYWIMADFRDGKATMDAAAGSPGLASQEDRTKKGRNSANGQWTMDGDPVPAAQGPRDTGKELLCQWRMGMGNGEWRRMASSCAQGRRSRGNDQCGSVREPMDAMEWTRKPGKM